MVTAILAVDSIVSVETLVVSVSSVVRKIFKDYQKRAESITKEFTAFSQQTANPLNSSQRWVQIDLASLGPLL